MGDGWGEGGGEVECIIPLYLLYLLQRISALDLIYFNRKSHVTISPWIFFLFFFSFRPMGNDLYETSPNKASNDAVNVGDL